MTDVDVVAIPNSSQDRLRLSGLLGIDSDDSCLPFSLFSHPVCTCTTCTYNSPAVHRCFSVIHHVFVRVFEMKCRRNAALGRQKGKKACVDMPERDVFFERTQFVCPRELTDSEGGGAGWGGGKEAAN